MLEVERKSGPVPGNRRAAFDGAGLWIVNLQPTDLDYVCGPERRINGRCDEIMRELVEELGVKVDGGG